MKWNNAKETRRFERKQAELRVEYLKAGMTEEQIHEMYLYDKECLLAERREAEHTQGFDFEAFDENVSDEGKNPLLDKFAENMTVSMDYSQVGRFAWIEELENEELVKAIKSMPESYLELLTSLYVDGLSNIEIAKQQNVSKQAITNKIERIKKIFKKFLG